MTRRTRSFPHRRALALLMALLLLAGVALAEEMDGGADWSFPVPLTDCVSSYAILVNNHNMLSEKDIPSPLVVIKGVKKATSAEIKLEATAAEALYAMFAGAAAEGYTLYLKSGYRAYSTQKTIYYNHLESTGGKDDGYVAIPGTSEHQTGLCADILNAEWADTDRHPKMNGDFKNTKEAAWMKAHCAEYGFILRYPEDQEDETEIAFEPWHFRYVGTKVASYIMEAGMTLERFTEEWQEAYAAFEDAGGSLEAQLEYEYRLLNPIPESHILEETDDMGDAEVTLDF